jgi:hypothetical protein
VQPIEAITAENWRRIEAVATDFDDTLTAHGCLTASSLAALEDLAAMGVPCVIVTGRPVGWAEVLAATLPVRAVVAENGSVWVVREERSTRVAFLEPESVRTEGLRRSRAMALSLTETYPALRLVEERVPRATDVTLDVSERAAVARDVVELAVARVRKVGLHAVASTVHLHVSHRAPDKMQGLRAAVGDLGAHPYALTDRWIYLGDSPNDTAPFAAMQCSVGVAGVERFAEVMPSLPKYVTRAGAGAALAEVVSLLRAHRRGTQP